MLRMVLGVLVVLVSIVERVSSTGVTVTEKSSLEVAARGATVVRVVQGLVILGWAHCLYISIHHGCDLCFSS